MSAPKENSVENSTIKRLGIIAGGGAIPERLLDACDRAGQDVFVVGFEGQTDPAIMEGRSYMMTRLGAAGQILDTFRAHDVKDLIMIGSVHRPSLTELKPDMRTIQFFASIGLKAMGDDSLLQIMRAELEREGFTIHGVQKFMKNILVGAGAVGRYKPKKADWVDIDRGIEVSTHLGLVDVGQSVIVQEGIVLGVEATEGTDELIKRCAQYKRKGRGGVLVKTCKPQQDHDFDLPTIGPETIRLCAASGLAGIVIQAGHSLLIKPQEVAALANQHKLFVFSMVLEEKRNAA